MDIKSLEVFDLGKNKNNDPTVKKTQKRPKTKNWRKAMFTKTTA